MNGDVGSAFCHPSIVAAPPGPLHASLLPAPGCDFHYLEFELHLFH